MYHMNPDDIDKFNARIKNLDRTIRDRFECQLTMLRDQLSLSSENRYGMEIDPDQPAHEQIILQIFRDIGRCSEVGFISMQYVEDGNEIHLQELLFRGDIQKPMLTPSILLTYASFLGRIGIMDLLLRYNWPVDDHVQDDNKTALCWAASNNRVEACRLLISYGANINHKCEMGSSLFLLASANGAACVMLQLLTDPNVDINQVEDEGYGAVHEAVAFRMNNETILETQPLLLLLCLGARVNIFSTDEMAYTPIHIACLIVAHDPCTMLLTFGADPDIRDNMGNTAAHLISNWETPEDMHQDHTLQSILISMLDLKKNMDISSRNHNGKTPAMIAARNSVECPCDQILTTLCEKGADMSIQDHSGITHVSTFWSKPSDRSTSKSDVYTRTLFG